MRSGQPASTIRRISAARRWSATSAAFAVGADGEMYIVNHTGGTVVKVVSMPVVPAAPTNLRIIR